MTEYQIVHNQNDRRFETTVDGQVAVLLYRLDDSRISCTSAQVPPPIEGSGIGTALARAGLEYARENSLTVVPICPFVRAFIEDNPEYQSLVE